MTKRATIAATLMSRVTDFAAWKTAFAAGASRREEAGILGHHIGRGADDPGHVCVLVAATDRDRLERFLAGVGGVQEIALLWPQEDRLDWSRPLAAALLSHEVEDYDRWKAMFDAGRETRQRAGVVGHVVARSARDPSQVLVYLQAESTDELRTLLTSSGLAVKMQRAGVTAPPRVSYLSSPS
jgi:hypothetical protein